MMKSRKRAECAGSLGSLPNKISKTQKSKKDNKNIEISNRFAILSDSENDDASLAESSMSSASAIPAVIKRPSSNTRILLQLCSFEKVYSWVGSCIQGHYV